MSDRRRREEGRGFGVGIGALLAIAGGIAWARDLPVQVVGALVVAGCSLLLVGLAWPLRLAGIARRWLGLAEGVAQVGNAIVLGFVFCLVVTPLGLLLRLFRQDPLDRRIARSADSWRPYPERQADRRHYERLA